MLNIGLNSTMVRLQLPQQFAGIIIGKGGSQFHYGSITTKNEKDIQRHRLTVSQFHYGSITTIKKGITRKRSKKVSIPLWFDYNDKEQQSSRFTFISLNSTMVRLQRILLYVFRKNL